MNHNVGALIDFGEPNIGVFVHSDSEGSIGKHGEILLYVSLILRMTSLCRNKDQKNYMLHTLSSGTIGMYDVLDQLLLEYSDFYKLSPAKVVGGANGNTKRGFTFILGYSGQKHTTRLKPRGFGLLGKNIEAAAFTAILVVFQFLYDKYQDNKEMLDQLSEVTEWCASYLEQNGGKTNVFKELEISEQLAGKYYPIA